MALTIDNNLPSNNIRFGGTHNHSEIIFGSRIDSWAAINVVNINIHQWVITIHPEIVSCYIQYDNEIPFDLIQLNFAVEDYEYMKDTYGKIKVLLVHSINYFHPNSTKGNQIGFVLGREVAFNAIIGMPTVKQWKDSIIFEGNFINSPVIQTQCPLICKSANTGIPSSASFEYK